jgi:hypothetical protein
MQKKIELFNSAEQSDELVAVPGTDRKARIFGGNDTLADGLSYWLPTSADDEENDQDEPTVEELERAEKLSNAVESARRTATSRHFELY